jgi:hypothetical protein
MLSSISSRKVLKLSDLDLERLINTPSPLISDMELYASNHMTREEIRHQNGMIKYRNRKRIKKALSK